MQSSTLNELIAFCESKKLTEVATGLKKELKTLQAPASSGSRVGSASAPGSTRAAGEESEKKVLKIIKEALKKEDRKQTQKEMKAKNSGGAKNGRTVTLPEKKKEPQAMDFNKEENEEIMEGLMNKIVALPSFINDDKLNAKIEKIFGVSSFQKMVDNADVFQDISNTSLFNASDIMGKSQQNQSFQKLLPSHSQIKEDDDPEELPRFGKSPGRADQPDAQQRVLDDEINVSVERILGPDVNPPQEQPEVPQPNPSGNDSSHMNEQPTLPINDDSFSNLQEANDKQPDAAAKDAVPDPASLKMSMIYHTDQGDNSFFQNQSSFVFGQDEGEQHSMNKEAVEEYMDDDDPGFDTYVVNEENFVASCRELADQNNFPARAIKSDTAEYMKFREQKKKEQKEARKKETRKSLGKDDSAVLLQNLQKKKDEQMKKAKAAAGDDELAQAEGAAVADTSKASKPEESKEQDLDEDDGRKVSVLPRWIKFMPSNDEFYPAEFDSVIYDCYNLRVVFDREKTGFEETKDFPIVINSIVAGRYQVVEYLGSAAFSKAIQCYDIHSEQMVCMKIIENNKDYFDQSVDEIKLLRYINANCDDLDGKNLLKLIDFFYHKEHLFIVTELLRDNLYEYSKFNREAEKKIYFNVPRLQRITKQILNALDFCHDLKLIHCDLKPENILIKSYSRCEIKVIDFGSSCFIHDHLSSYVQSRSYRAPEVILGCRYDYKIDIWSLGCILAELFTGYVLFQNDSVQGLLSRVIGIIGPVPEYMMKEGRLVSNFFTREGLIYQEGGNEDGDASGSDAKKKADKSGMTDEELKIHILVAKRTTLKKRLKCDDQYFVDFVRWLLEVDPLKRPTAKEALQHPWLTECTYEIE